MRWRIALLLLSACNFDPKFAARDAGGDDDSNDGPPPIDAAIDTPPDGFDAACFGSGDFYFCLGATPAAGELQLDSGIDTASCPGATVMIAGKPACALASEAIRVTATVGLSGDKPLVLVATTTITVEQNGVLDASSALGNEGPRAPDTQCNTAGVGTDSGGGGSGGAGGSFGSKGGNGGIGDQGAANIPGGTAANPIAAPIHELRGGCPGGKGGAGDTLPSNGGEGGGAIYLAARTSIDIAGAIDASGAGGEGGLASFGGGGGGGSGGMIVLWTSQLDVTGSVVANGGGGGGGAGNTATGEPGRTSDPAMPQVAALGGQDATAGRQKGGNGAAGTTAATAGPASGNGAGAGGGGLGVIRVLAGGTIDPARVSPAPQ